MGPRWETARGVGAAGAPEERMSMASNIDVMKKAYEAFYKGKAEDAVDAFAEDAVWQGPDSTELPGGGEHRGRDAIVQAMESVGIEWDSFELTPDEFFEDGDTVVVLGHSEVSKGGNSGKIPVVHVARFEDGKVKRFQVLTDTLLSAQLLGLIGGKAPEGDRQETD
jgi:ketosteroid isomerase-like protein